MRGTDFKRSLKYILVGIAGGLLFSQCLEPFNPAVRAADLNVLVIEGYINANGETSVKISKAIPLGAGQDLLHEKEAAVVIESSEGSTYPLTEISPGTYATSALDLPTEPEYRLYIKLKNGKEYRSQFTPVKITPPIDSVYWKVSSDLLHIYVDTHDESNKTNYYKWTYQEDWQVKSVQPAYFKYEDDTVKWRDASEVPLMLNCWKSARAQNVIIGSSNLYPHDEMKFSVNQLAFSGERTNVKYSTIVRQHALQEKEFEYLQLLLKNAELGGTFFDPMPAQLYGNIHNEDAADEIVVGYVGAYTTQYDTLFIYPHELPFGPSSLKCITRKFRMDDADSLSRYMTPPSRYNPIDTWVDQFGNPWMEVMLLTCLDCRIQASTQRPSYWGPSEP